MKMRPLIGVPTQTLQSIDGIPEELPHSWVMNHRYFVALEQVGAVPVMVPLLKDETLRAMYERFDGVFLAGGVDMDPASYGEAFDADACGRIDPARDRVELRLARWALEEGKPLLGVCRGMQVLNVLRGGTLHQDCTLYPEAIKHDYLPHHGHARDFLAHEVSLAEGSRLRRILGADVVRVNSMHHQAIDRLGADLVVSARAPDGMIEALEVEGPAFALAVQWHPEMLIDSDPGTQRLFEAFVEAAASRRAEALLGSVA